MLRQHQVSGTLCRINRLYFCTRVSNYSTLLASHAAHEDEEQWQVKFDKFKTQIVEIKPDTTQFYIPPSNNEVDTRDFFLLQRKLYIKRQLLPHRQWALEKFGIPLEWPRRPRWIEANNLLQTNFGDVGKDSKGKKEKLSLITPIYDPFEHPSFPDNLMKQDREEFFRFPEYKEWFDMMPSVLKQIRVAGRLKLNKGKYHSIEGLYDEDGNPQNSDISEEDYFQMSKDRNAWKTAMNRRKRAMILLKALENEKIQPEHLMYTELDMVVYELLKLNKYHPDKPARKDKKIVPKNYRERAAKPKRHYIRNERSKAARLRGYLEWYWEHSLEGRDLMKKRRQRSGEKMEEEQKIKQSLQILEEELAQIRLNLETATENIDKFDKVIKAIKPKDLPEIDTQTGLNNYDDKNPNWFDKRWKWLMYKENLLKDYARVKEIVNYFTFRLSDFEDPLDSPDSKFGRPHWPYPELVYESGFPTGLEKESLQRQYEARETWHDTDELYKPKYHSWKDRIISEQKAAAI